MAGHRHAGGIWRRRPRHHRSRDHDAGGGQTGAAWQGASAIHLNVFGPNPIVVFGTEEQKKRMLPRLIKGKVAFAVTEPDAGLNTTALKTSRRAPRRLRRPRQEDLDHDGAGRRQDAADHPHDARRRCKRPTDGCRSSTPTSTAARSRCARSRRWAARRSTPTRCSSTGCSCRRGPHRRGGQGLPLPAARPEPRAHPDRGRGDRHRPGRAAPRRDYAKERVVFGRPIGQNQAIQHPLAERWMAAGGGQLMVLKARLAVRQRQALRRRGQCGQVSRRATPPTTPASRRC